MFAGFSSSPYDKSVSLNNPTKLPGLINIKTKYGITKCTVELN
jgi:hypothetical protein